MSAEPARGGKGAPAEVLLYACPPLRARLTEAGCAGNKAKRAEAEKAGDTMDAGFLEPCRDCPGVAALASRRGAAQPIAFKISRERAKPKRGKRSYRTLGSEIVYTPRKEEPAAKPEPEADSMSRGKPAPHDPLLVTFAELAKEEGLKKPTLEQRLYRARHDGDLEPVNPGGSPLLFRRVDADRVIAKVHAYHKARLHPPAAGTGRHGTKPAPKEAAPLKAKPPAKSGVAVAASGDLGAIWEKLSATRGAHLIEIESMGAKIAELEGKICALDEGLAAVRKVAELAGVELPAEVPAGG